MRIILNPTLRSTQTWRVNCIHSVNRHSHSQPSLLRPPPWSSHSCCCLEQQLVRHEAHTLADPQSRSSAVKRPVVCLGVVSRSNADELILTILFFRRKAVKRKTVSTGAVAEIFILSCSTLLCLLLVSPPRLRAVPWWAVLLAHTFFRTERQGSIGSCFCGAYPSFALCCSTKSRSLAHTHTHTREPNVTCATETQAKVMMIKYTV
jgi:hypothetical protein